MEYEVRQATAQIFEFRRKVGSAIPVKREQSQVVDFRRMPIATDFGSAWYHEAAVRDERIQKP